MEKVVFGCGYLGMRVACRWLQSSARVTVLTRSPQRAAQLASLGLSPVVGDITESLDASVLRTCETVLFAVGFDRSQGNTIEQVYVDGLRRVLDILPSRVGRMIYISSSGVYGQTDGQWVNEASICQPRTPGGKACLEAERLLSRHPVGESSIVLRLAGIYGPGRIPRSDMVSAGEPLKADPDSTLNLIHVDDAVEVILAAEQSAKLPNLFVVSDGRPVRRSDFYAQVARLLGAPSPRFVPPAPSSSTGLRGLSDKRLCNEKLRRELQIEFAYPDFRSGLAASL